jgi:hypothetical protein
MTSIKDKAKELCEWHGLNDQNGKPHIMIVKDMVQLIQDERTQAINALIEVKKAIEHNMIAIDEDYPYSWSDLDGILYRALLNFKE